MSEVMLIGLEDFVAAVVVACWATTRGINVLRDRVIAAVDRWLA